MDDILTNLANTKDSIDGAERRERASFGPYEVLDADGLGDGLRASLVLRCRHAETGEPAAVKLARTPGRAHRELLRSEVAALRRLARADVPGVVRVLDHGLHEPLPWYAMELVEGISIRQFHARLWEALLGPGGNTGVTATVGLDDTESAHEAPSPGSPASVARANGPAAPTDTSPVPAGAGAIERIARIIRSLADVLTEVHAHGVVHGDVTPDNVILRGGLDPVLIDFDASLVTLEPGVTRELPFGERAGRGTPSYVAPEVISGDVVDARCDLYAVGCILYELLSGHRPFTGSRKEDVLQQQLVRTPPPLEACVRAVPPELAELVRGLLVKDPAERIGSAEDVSRALSAWLGETARGSSRRAPLYRPRLRGRDPELRALQSHIDALGAGRGGFVLVEGASGMGKTRLLNELATYAHKAGAAVRWCRSARTAPAPEQRGAVPGSGLGLFGPAVEFAKERLSAGAGHPKNGEPGLEFERLKPYAADVLGAVRADDRRTASDPELEKLEAQRALFDVLARSSTQGPWLLLIDDLHLADELSISFLGRFAEELSGTRVLVIANSDLHEAPPTFASLREKASAELELRALDLAETRGMVKDLLGVRALPDGLADFVHEHSEGNPFWIAEYLDTAIAKRYLERGAEGDWLFSLARSTQGPAPIPSSIEELLAERVRRLSPTGTHVLAVASVLGRDFDPDLLARLLESEDDARDGIAELLAHRVLVPKGPELTFCHLLLQELEERWMDPALRRDYHRRAATLLERSTSDGQNGLARLGYHWSGAGEPERALSYLERAAQRALETHALASAASLFRACLRELALLRAAPSTTMRRLSLCEALADVLVARALHGEARLYLEQALASLPEGDAVTRARLHRKIATTHWTVHEYDAAAEQLRCAERALLAPNSENAPDYWTELIQIRLGRFEQLYFAGRTGPELDELVDELAPLIEQRGNEQQRCVYYFIAASNLMLRKRYAYDEGAVTLAQKGLDAAATLPLHRRVLARFMVGFTRAFGTRAECELAERDFDAALEEVGKIEQATLKSRIAVYRAVASLRLGRVEATARAAELALESAELARLPPYVGAAQVCLGWAAWRRGEIRLAEDLLSKARKLWKAHPHKLPVQNLAVFIELAMASARDDFDAAKALLTELTSGLPALPEPLPALVRAAAEAIEAGEPREITSALRYLSSEAQAAGYA